MEVLQVSFYLIYQEHLFLFIFHGWKYKNNFMLYNQKVVQTKDF